VADIVRLRREEPAPRIAVEVDEDLGDLSPAVGSALFRIAQESVTNAVRHARGATVVEVGVRRDGDATRITVRDDGGGTADERRATTGYGLLGMQERVALLGGSFRAGPRPDGGWLVDAWLPAGGRPR
jgi:signal transduction histidine kinase